MDAFTEKKAECIPRVQQIHQRIILPALKSLIAKIALAFSCQPRDFLAHNCHADGRPEQSVTREPLERERHRAITKTIFTLDVRIHVVPLGSAQKHGKRFIAPRFRARDFLHYSVVARAKIGGLRQ